MSKPFTAYWSLLGYLPDLVPPEFDTKDEALGYLADEIRLVFDEQPEYMADYLIVQEAIEHLYAHGWTTYDGLFFGIDHLTQKESTNMFKLEIETTNEAFDPYPSDEVANLLEIAAHRVRGGFDSGSLFDTNGNKVGHFEFTMEDY